MSRRAILRIALAVFILAAAVAGFLLASTGGLRFSLRMAGTVLPGTLTVDSVQGRLAGALTLEGVAYRDEGVEVAAEALSLSWQPASFLHGRLHIGSVALSGLVIRIDQSETTESLPPFALPVPVTMEKATISSFRLFFSDDPEPVQIDGILLENVQVRGDRVRVDGLEVSTVAGRLKLRGEVQTSGEYKGRLTGDYSFIPPGYFPIEGSAEMEGTLMQLAVRLDMAAPFSGTLQGTVHDLAGDARWNAEIFADEARLAEISREWPEFVLSNFRAAGNGTLAGYSLQVETGLTYEHLQDVHAAGTIDGDAEGLRFSELRLRRFDAALTGEGQLGWPEEGLTWQAEVSGTNIDPAAWQEKWPGRLDFRITTSGALKGEAVQGVVELVALDGRLRDYPLQASGRIEMDNDSLNIDHLSLRSAESVLQASGRYADLVDLNFDLRSPDLASLWPGAAGSFQVRGSLRGSRPAPSLRVDLTGAEISLHDSTMAKVAAAMEGDLGADRSLTGTVRATGVTVAGVGLDSVNADLHGTAAKHRLQADVQAGGDSLRLQVEGGLDDSGWQGVIAGIDLKEHRLGSWHLGKPAPLAISARASSLKQLCLAGPSTGRICLDGSFAPGGPWRAGAAIEAFPLEILPSGLPENGRLEGLLSGVVAVEGDGTGIRSGGLELATGEAAIILAQPDGSTRKIAWRNNKLQATLADERLSAQLAGLLADGGAISGSLLLDEFRVVPFSLQRSRIDASAQFEIRDLQPLAALVYPTADPYGRLHGNLRLQGAAAGPEMTASVALAEGEVSIPPLGIVLKELEMKAAGSYPEFRLELTGTSGGQLRGEGDLSLAEPQHPELNLNIRGEGVELARLPELDLLVSPDVTVALRKDRGEIRGTIRIPEARIAPRDLSGAISPSADVVIVGSRQEPAKSAWPLSADLLVIAGDDVRVDAFGLRGKVAGRLQVTDLPGKPVTGDGILNVVEGTFAVYGRELTIQTGRLLYSGNPLDNPGVEVRAENTTGEITTGIQVTGFLAEPEISFYSDPPMAEDEIISRLLMNTALLGSAKGDGGFLGSVTSGTGLDPVTSAVRGVKESLRLDEVKIETGKTREDLSLVIGTWLSPDLYVSYGKNLLKESGSFNTRYLLGHGFSVQTETGATQSGMDLKFEIDRY